MMEVPLIVEGNNAAPRGRRGAPQTREQDAEVRCWDERIRLGGSDVERRIEGPAEETGALSNKGPSGGSGVERRIGGPAEESGALSNKGLSGGKKTGVKGWKGGAGTARWGSDSCSAPYLQVEECSDVERTLWGRRQG